MSKLFAMIPALTLLVGCDTQNRPLTSDDGAEQNLSQVGELCRHYQFAKQKPPSKLGDLMSVKAQGTNGFNALQAGSVILRYGATLPDLSEEPGKEPSDEILAYLKETPESGGKVLLLNRTVKSMTADEFKSAKLAGNPASPDTQKKK
jgi:hypothetical protein